MTAKKVLRIISGFMIGIFVVYILCAVSNPAMGELFYIGSFRVDAYVMRVFYVCYILVATGLFIASFFLNKSNKN